MAQKQHTPHKHVTSHKLHQQLNHLISVASGYVELVLGCVIVAVIMIMAFDIIRKFPQYMFDFEIEGFLDFLADMLTLVVGLEFVKMLCMHTPETVIEVLLFATARHMVVGHLNSIETLIGVVTIGVLFAIRKFLFLGKQDLDTGDGIPEEDTETDEPAE